MKTKHITQVFILIAAIMLLAVPSHAAYDPSLVAYWKLDETAGDTAYDSTTNDNDGTVTGATMGVTGQYGTAYDFDGDDDYVGTSAALDANINLSVSAWFKTSSTPAYGQYIASHGGSWSSGDIDWILFVSDDGKVWINPYRYQSSPLGAVAQDRDYRDGEWHHVVGVIENDTVHIYTDGVFRYARTDANEFTPGKSDVVQIGTRPGGGDYFFDGTIDEVAIWDKALNWDQIEFIYNHGVEYFEERGQVPEPASMLFALAGLGFALKRRRRS